MSVQPSPMANRVAFKKIPRAAKGTSGLPRILLWVLFALFVIQFALVLVRLWMPSFLFGDSRWPDGMLVILAGSTLVASLSRQLPSQNVMLAGIIIAFFSGAVETVGALTGVPFGPFIYTDNIGPQLFYPLPWAIPVVWIIAILSSRGVARIMLRPWRKTRAYGYWLMSVTAALVVLLDLGLEPFATRVKRYWLWNPTKLGLDWYGAPLVNFLGWAVTVLLILAFVTPSLINKKPVKQPADYYPLVVWLLLNVAFAAGAVVTGLWTAVIVISAGCLIATVFAVRGARW